MKRMNLFWLAAVGLLAWIGWSDYSQNGSLQPVRAIDSKYLAAKDLVSNQKDWVTASYAKQAEQATDAPADAPPPTIKPTATPRPTRVSTTTGPTLVAENISLLVHDLINEERIKHGLSELMYDDDLGEIAKSHSEDMAQQGFFAHDNLEGQSFSDRYARGSYVCVNKQGMTIYGGAENIYTDWRYGTTTYSGGRIINREWHSESRIAQRAVDGWMNSPGHRANILTGVFNSEGIGVGFAQNGEILITQNFC